MNNIKNLAEEAVNLHKTGQINAAKKKYLDVLKIDPKNFQIKRLLALAEYSLEYYNSTSPLMPERPKTKKLEKVVGSDNLLSNNQKL